MSPHIRWAIRRDMPAILEIEAASFADRWTECDFLNCLSQRNCIGVVAMFYGRDREDECHAGFMIYELHPEKLHVVNLAVADRCRRSGVGSALVAALIRKLSSHRRTHLTAAVREKNLPAQFFFRALGFRAVRVLRGHYGGTEDAYLMRFAVEGAEPLAESELLAGIQAQEIEADAGTT